MKPTSSGKDGDRAGVLGERAAVRTAHHDRVPEPTVGSLLATDGAPAVDEAAMVVDALKVMSERDSGAVVVLSDGGVAGVFSERDYARNGLLGNRTPGNTSVADVMTRSADFVTPAQTVADCLALMDEKGLAYLPVVDQGRLVGLLSEADLLKARLKFHERVFNESELDQKLLFLRGTYSC